MTGRFTYLGPLPKAGVENLHNASSLLFTSYDRKIYVQRIENYSNMTTAERIYKELLHEPASVWFINDNFGAKVMVKLTSPIIKAVVKGCKVEFLFARDNSTKPAILHTGVRIYDDLVHYAAVIGTDCFADQHTSLAAIMNRSYTYIHLHNELSMCTATAKLSFKTADQMRVLNLLANTDKLYCGKFDQKVMHSLDRFEGIINGESEGAADFDLETITAEAEFGEWSIMKNSVICFNETSHLMISDQDEGSILEKEVNVVLDALFNTNLYLNPQIPRAQGYRELTDVLAFNSLGVFLIESKALGVIDRAVDKSMEKKVKGIQKQISNGISQLAGAVKKLDSGVKVYDKKLKEIIFERRAFPHCIVLVSELLPFGEWKQIELEMLNAMIESRIYLNVMDLREFMQYVGYARGSADSLNLMLIERVEAFVKNETIHMRLNAMEG